jgi:hypothetical protein
MGPLLGGPWGDETRNGKNGSYRAVGHGGLPRNGISITLSGTIIYRADSKYSIFKTYENRPADGAGPELSETTGSRCG